MSKAIHNNKGYQPKNTFKTPIPHELFHRFSGLGGSVSFIRAVYSFVGVCAITYLLFQKKLLPLPVAKIVSKVFFYPTFPFTAILRLGNYWTKVDETLYLGCAPMGLLKHPKKLYDMGVRGVVNMCYEYEGPVSSYKELGIKQLHLPTVDHTEPSVESIQKAVAFIEQCQKDGQKVLVHCKAGHGRGASVALAWMIHENNKKNDQFKLTAKVRAYFRLSFIRIYLYHILDTMKLFEFQELNAILRRRRKVRSALYEQSNIQAYIATLKKSD